MLDGSLSSANKAALLPTLPVNGPDLIAPALTVDPVASPDRGATKAISGTVEAGIAPMVAVNGGTPVPAIVTGTNWNAQVTGLATGANNISVTAGDLVGNTAGVTAAITIVQTDGHFGTPGPVNVSDALKALRIAANLVTPTTDDILHGDCAPLGAPDGVIMVDDALLILRKAVGLVNF
jgi:hypothetical protein